jgi:hypothetical protein
MKILLQLYIYIYSQELNEKKVVFKFLVIIDFLGFKNTLPKKQNPYKVKL